MIKDYLIELNGTWKPYGQYVNKDRKIIIHGHELTFETDAMSSDSKTATVHFHLVEENSLRENHCYNIKIDEEQYKNTDFMVHEELIEGKPVVILSYMGMEQDGRGRIVFFSYVREKDYALVNDEYKSLAYQYWNERPPVPMMQVNPEAGIPMGVMGGMMPGMMGGMTADMISNLMSGMTAAIPSQVTQVKPWDCTCGNKQITSKFCPECGLPMQKQ